MGIAYLGAWHCIRNIVLVVWKTPNQEQNKYLLNE